MIKSARRFVWRTSMVLVLTGMAPAYAADPSGTLPGTLPGPLPATSIDPALQSALNRAAASLLTSFASSIATGSIQGFDPGPAIEKTLRGVLASGELELLIDRLANQALAAGAGASKDLSPELRAALALTARSLISGARREIQRELAAP